jgi:hypothetical protein
LVVVNFDKEPSQVQVAFPKGAWERLGLAPTGTYTLLDVISQETFQMMNGQVNLALPAHGYRILKMND